MRERFESIAFSLLLFLFTVFLIAFPLYWASNTFFQPLRIDIEFLLYFILSGAVILIEIPIIRLVRSVVEEGNLDQDLLDLNNIIELFDRSKNMIQRVSIFLVLYLALFLAMNSFGLPANLLRESFRTVMSMFGFAFVLYVMIVEP